jgi:NitT/TauT family transport system substrate-binding protein
MRSPLLVAFAVASAVVAGVSVTSAETVRVGSMPVLGNVSLFCMLEHGAPASEGIELQLTPFSAGSRIIEAIAGGALDLGYSATLSILQASHQGLDVRIVAPGGFVPRNPAASIGSIVVRKDSGISTPAQLRGKTIAVNALGSINQLWAADYLARHGVAPSDVTWQEIPFHVMPLAIEHGRVAAASTSEPFSTILRDSGKVTLLPTLQDSDRGTSLSAYVALTPWTRARATQLDAFLRAFRRGVAACQRDSALLRQALVKHAGLKADMADRIELQDLRPAITAADIAPVQTLARRHKLLERELNVETLLLPGAGAR